MRNVRGILKTRTSLWWIELALVLIFFVITGISVMHTTPWTIGDGYEYILQTVAVRNHHSFGINDTDYNTALQEFPDFAQAISKIYDKDLGIGSNGLRYSNHFGIYSALVVPVKLLLMATNHNPVYAFRITNIILWFAAAMVVLLFLKTDDRRRLGVLALILFNPVYFYADWIHAETFIFAFAVMGLVFYYNKKYSLGILFVSIAAMQNLGILPLGMIIGLEYIWNRYLTFQQTNNSKNVWKFIKTDWLKIIPYGLLYVPALLPMITCYMHFGVFNRVADVATEKSYLMEKAWAYLFDLNMGIAVYAPIVLAAFLILTVYGITKKNASALLNLLAFAGTITIISFELHVNCGMEGISRYGVWILPSLIFYVAMNLNANAKVIRYFILIGAEAVITAVMVYATLWGSPQYNSYMQFAPWTEYVLDKCPQLYNPVHSIFYTRIRGIEDYYSPVPVFFRNDDGYIRKIILSPEAVDVFYNSPAMLIDTDGNIIDRESLNRHIVDDGRFSYINLPANVLDVYSYDLGEDIIYFNKSDYNADLYAIKGMYKSESWGSWTIGDELETVMFIDDDADLLHCHLDVINTFYQPQPVTVYVNDQEVYTITVEGDQDIDFDFANPDIGIVDIRFELPGATSPADVLGSDDPRILAIGLVTMEITEAE